jgi:hypothetical protein
MQSSDEATPEQLELARAQGAALQRAVEHMTQKEAHGAEVRAGDYWVGYAVEAAEGMYMPHDGRLQWHEPQNENVHLEVSVRDGADGRFVPGLTVRATLVTASGQEVGTHEQPFIWHPWLYHYGRNWQVPGSGRYTLRVHIEPAPFHRHDKKNGQRYAAPVDVEFTDIQIETGQKKSK